MGPNDPFASTDSPQPEPADRSSSVAVSARSPLERKATIGALSGALIAVIGAVVGPWAAASVVLLAALGAGLAIAVHFAGSRMVRQWLVGLLGDPT